MTGRRSPGATETLASFSPVRREPPLAPPSAYAELYRQVSEDQHAAVEGEWHPLDRLSEGGCDAATMGRQVLEEAFVDPFTNVPTDNPAAIPGHVVNSVLGMIGAVEQLQYVGIAALTAPIAALTVPLPVVTLTSICLGIPHTHTHPPSTTPPAPPIPMPSFGMMLIPGAINVLTGGLPAARAGDVAMIPTCVSFGAPAEVVMGSSNTFFGGGRVSRVGTDFFYHDNPTPLAGFSAAMAVAGAAGQILTAVGQAAEGNFAGAALSVAQQQADAAAIVLKELRKVDPGAPPDMGAFVTGAFTVLVGGFPLPPAADAEAIFKRLRGLASAVTSPRRNTSDDASSGRTGRDDDGDTCGGRNCP